MKTKKYLFLMLAAALFAACSNDDEDGSTPPTTDGTEQTPTEPSDSTQAVIDFADYSNVIGMSYSTMILEYPNPDMAFDGFYAYFDQNDGKVTYLTFLVNPDNQTVYSVMELLAKDAYKAEDIADYFASKYTTYSKEAIDLWDEEYENVIGSTYAYTFGNADNEEDATLVIEVYGNQSVSYTNPKNMPTESDGFNGFDDMTPEEAVNSFLMKSIEDIEDEYPGAFAENYQQNIEDNYYLMCIFLNPVDGIVTSITLLYNEDLSDEDIIEYYTELGYTATKTGTNQNGNDKYTITNGVISIEYADCIGVITFVAED